MILASFSCGLVLLVLAVELRRKSQRHNMLGISIILISLIGLLGAGGFLIGLVLGILGGALAIRWKPTPLSSNRHPPSALSSTVMCSNCRYVNPIEFVFCGRCGAPLKEEETRTY